VNPENFLNLLTEMCTLTSAFYRRRISRQWDECDCIGNDGCKGGAMGPAFEYINKNKGINTEESYTYQERVSKLVCPCGLGIARLVARRTNNRKVVGSISK